MRVARQRAALAGQNPVNHRCNLIGKVRRDSIADLSVLVGDCALEEVVVRKCLETRCLADTQASALFRLVVDVVMTVLGDVGDDRG